MLAPGSLVTVNVSGEAHGLQTADDVLASTITELTNDYGFSVKSSAIGFQNSVVYDALHFNWLHYNYVAQLTVSVPADTYDTADDVGGDVGNAFADIAGAAPTGIQARSVGSAPPIAAPSSGDFSLGIGIGAISTALLIGGLVVVAAVLVARNA